MVALLDTGRSLLRELDWQDVDRSRSRVYPVSCPVDPMRRYVRPGRPFSPRDVRVSARLQELQWLLEWAYGYRAPKDARQRATRRAPSAGALYPTENFVVVETGQGWQVLYYDYGGRQFYAAPAADARAVAEGLGLRRGEEAILFASVLWRTLQRYGVRGYRYCLLDAAHVASNLGRAARAFGREFELDPWSPTAELESLLDLDHGEVLLLAARTRPGPAAVPPELGEVLVAPVGTAEQPPRFSPVLRRAIDFHRRTLANPDRATAVPWPDANDSPEDLRRWAGERCSARDFTGETVTAEQYARMAAAAAGAQPVFGQHAPSIRFYGITTRVQGLAVGSGLLGAEDGGRWEIPGQTPTGMTQALSEVCQNQSILKPTAFTFVLAARKAELAAHGHPGYRALVLNAGFLCADLYREAARCGLGTTSVGGFSDEAVCRLLGDRSLTPIVIQTFGVPARSGEKVDAARVVGLDTGTPAPWRETNHERR
jgi:nitroreductase